MPTEAATATTEAGKLQQGLQDLAEGHFVANRLSDVKRVADQLYTRAETSSNPLVKLGVGTFERCKSNPWITGFIPVQALSRYGKPVVQTLDSSLATAYVTIDGRVVKPILALKGTHGDVLVTANWFNKVDAILAEQVQPLQQFYTAAADAFSNTYVNKKQYEDFMADLQSKIRNLTNDQKFLVRAKQFYVQAHQRVATLDLSAIQNQRDYLRQHLANFQLQTITAQRVYSAAVDQYVSLAGKLKQQGESQKEFLESMRQRLGSSWNERLVVPLTEFYNNVKGVTREDLDNLRSKLEEKYQLNKHATDLRSRVTQYVEQNLTSALNTSNQVVEYLLPEAGAEADAEQEPTTKSENDNVVTFKTLGCKVSKRLQKRAAVRMGELRHFSAHRMKSIVHVDLIAYAEEVIDTANASRSKFQGEVATRFSKAVSVVETKLDAAKTAVHEANQQSVSPRLLNLRQRLYSTISVIRSLSASGYSAVRSRSLSALKTDSYRLLLQSLGYQEHGEDFAAIRSALSELAASVKDLIQFYRLEEHSESTTDAEEPDTTTTSTPPTKEPATVKDPHKRATVVVTSAPIPVSTSKSMESVQPTADKKEAPLAARKSTKKSKRKGKNPQK